MPREYTNMVEEIYGFTTPSHLAVSRSNSQPRGPMLLISISADALNLLTMLQKHSTNNCKLCAMN